jgi:hypothetical protein
MPNGSDIIVRAASAEVEFDPAVYLPDPANPKKHKNASKKVTQVVITGDINFDSGDHPNGLKCEIKVFVKP